MSLMWFYDEVPEEYRQFRQEAQHLEKEHLETRTALRDAQAARRADPENPALQVRVTELETKLADLDKRAPWISQGSQLEMLLWGVPH
jgi:tRNA A37 N6-isopentenylltransferase MiaA